MNELDPTNLLTVEDWGKLWNFVKQFKSTINTRIKESQQHDKNHVRKRKHTNRARKH